MCQQVRNSKSLLVCDFGLIKKLKYKIIINFRKNVYLLVVRDDRVKHFLPLAHLDNL